MSVHIINELKRRIKENDEAPKDKISWCTKCGLNKSARGNSCSTCYLVELSDKMTPNEYEAFKSEVVTG